MTDSPEPAQDAPTELPPADRPLPARTEVYLRKPPIWSYFLTPAAVLVGAAMIAGAVWWTADDDDASTLADDLVTGGEAVTTVEPGSLLPLPTQAPPAGLLDTFNAYAQALELDMDRFGQCLGQQSNVVLLNDHVTRGAELGVNGTPTFFINNKRLVGSQPAAILEEIVQKELSETPPTTLDEYSDAVRSLGDNFAIVPEGPALEGAVWEGSPVARVVIAEFSDFQCPFCKRWSEQVLPSLRSQLGDQVSLAFLHYPITQIHPNAGNASVVAICAGEQGKFWEMHDLLFARQAEWADLR